MSNSNSSASNKYFIILAGGGGERLWPLSRRACPKQLLPFMGDSSLLRQTVERIQPITQAGQCVVVTTNTYHKAVAQALEGFACQYAIEPAPRNTAAAILLACLQIQEKDPDAVVAVLPSDHFIPDGKTFCAFLDHAFDFASAHDALVLLGKRPIHPETGYGYIVADTAHGGSAPVPIVRFHEKPSRERAQEFLNSGTTFWNMGIVCARVATILDEAQKHAPEIFAQVQAHWAGTGSYEKSPATSFDYAVLEKSTRSYVLPVDFVWCDVGNLAVFMALQQKYRRHDQKVVTVEACDNLVDCPGTLVALVGVNNLCVVQSGDVLLITHRDQAYKIRDVLRQLEDAQEEDYL